MWHERHAFQGRLPFASHVSEFFFRLRTQVHQSLNALRVYHFHVCSCITEWPGSLPFVLAQPSLSCIAAHVFMKAVESGLFNESRHLFLLSWNLAPAVVSLRVVGSPGLPFHWSGHLRGNVHLVSYIYHLTWCARFSFLGIWDILATVWKSPHPIIWLAVSVALQGKEWLKSSKAWFSLIFPVPG